ncbi:MULTISPECIES: beta-ketoacyl-ACP synthase III [Micrococcaceae]|uniref:beta-ketoacyl-ACP synthase III n=1 Tax=unclassified Kocuria TaxID=2649579 RepID=UPI001011FDF7|nr:MULTISPECIES: beta-ketoacyl-ACP synthase III [unclassified Kocuria]
MPIAHTSAQHGSKVVGLGHFQPEKVLTNFDIAKMVDTSDEWIQSRTGIVERHIASEDESVADLAVGAARMALEDAGLHDVDLVVLASTTATDRSPNTAGRVSQRLGFTAPAIMDVNTACSGFEYAMGIADQAIRAGSAETALVIGSEKLSAVTDWTDRRTCILTADGAGAVVLQKSEEPQVSQTIWGSVPSMADAVVIHGDPEFFTQDGRQVMRWAFTDAAKQAHKVLDAAGLSLEDIDVFAFHQANLRLVEPLAKALKATDEQIVIKDVIESGNTSAASVPLGLSKYWHRGDLPRGGMALLLGFGGGFAFAGQVVRLPE